jgi:hypothetical protein
MTVLTKSKEAAGRIRRHRDERPGRVAQRSDAPSPALQPAATAPRDAPAHRERIAGRTQDSALYTCQCGFVFEAAVSTSVGCPHCGGTQAW